MNGTYIAFVMSVNQAPKTCVWDVVPKELGAVRALGQVKWFGRWRKYAFFPANDTVFEQMCLREIALFCEEQTRLRTELKVATKEIERQLDLLSQKTEQAPTVEHTPKNCWCAWCRGDFPHPDYPVGNRA